MDASQLLLAYYHAQGGKGRGTAQSAHAPSQLVCVKAQTADVPARVLQVNLVMTNTCMAFEMCR
jgi:hypothetical protein